LVGGSIFNRGGVAVRSSKQSYDDGAARRLWQVSTEQFDPGPQAWLTLDLVPAVRHQGPFLDRQQTHVLENIVLD
jgi:hypothetical protein